MDKIKWVQDTVSTISLINGKVTSTIYGTAENGDTYEAYCMVDIISGKIIKHHQEKLRFITRELVEDTKIHGMTYDEGSIMLIKTLYNDKVQISIYSEGSRGRYLEMECDMQTDMTWVNENCKDTDVRVIDLLADSVQLF